MADAPSIVPYLSYVDARAAMTFLTEAFGLEVVQSYEDENGRSLHAEFRHGNGVVLLGSVDAAPAHKSPGYY